MNSGLREIQIEDAERGVRFPAVVQYPTEMAATGTVIGPYHFDATRDAPPAHGRFPLCVISHGGGGSHLLYRSIASQLAANGFVVVSLEHPGDNRNDRSHSNTDRAALDRPRHVSRAIDAVLEDATLRSCVDPARVCAIGHSMGGFTALALVGGHPWSRNGEPLPTIGDSRVRAAVLLAPAVGWFGAPGALDDISVPLLVMVGEHDEVTTPAEIRRVLAALPEHTAMTLEIVPNAGHFAFITPFPPHMKRPDFPPSTDPAGFDRSRFHLGLPVRIGAFLASALGSRRPRGQGDQGVRVVEPAWTKGSESLNRRGPRGQSR